MKYGLTIGNVDYATKKAREKKDGVYTIRGFAYRVRKGKVTHFAYNGEILLWTGWATLKVGSYVCSFSGDCDKKALENI